MDAVAKAPYAARCPGCDSPAIDTLREIPDVPIYACGYSGRSHATGRRETDGGRIQQAYEGRNLVGLELDEAAWIADLGVAIVAGGSGVTWASDPRISLGACGHVVIDGECLLPDDPGEAGGS